MQDSKELLLNRMDSSEKDMKVHRGFNIPPEEEAFLLGWNEMVASGSHHVLRECYTQGMTEQQDFDIPPEEKAFLLQGKEGVANALQEILDLQIQLDPSKDSEELLSNRVNSSEKDVMVRQDFDIPPEEKAFLLKRKEVVANALQEILNIPLDHSKYKVPTVAVVCSGGGSRAMIGTYGSLKGLQSLGLLDVITYMTAVSGSTWTFASLFSDDSWSKENLDKEIASKKKELSKSTFTIFFRKLWYYRSERHNRKKEGYPVSIVDLWGLVIEQLIFGKKHTKTLSDQKMAVFKGQNPLPIYTAVEMDDSASAQPHHDWCEFTPFEVGFFKNGAFVSAEDFGSKFYNGHVVKKLPETRIPFLLGIWSSFFSANLLELWTYFRDFWKEGYANQKCQSMGDVIHCRPLISKVFNFLKGLFRNNASLETDKDTDSNAVPNKLSPTHSYLNLVDSAHAIDIAFPPVLRPHRRADIILSLNYSLETDHLQVK
ncbi:cytosolic phospholipase A2 beta-like [Clarias gariepinus]